MPFSRNVVFYVFLFLLDYCWWDVHLGQVTLLILEKKLVIAPGLLREL
jgi:hypothetical protein